MNENIVTPLIGLLVTTLLGIWRTPAIRDGVFARIAKLPRSLQWVAPLVLAMAAATCEGFLSGKTGEALFVYAAGSGAEAGALAIAIWHVYKRIRASRVAEAAAFTIALLASGNGCKFLRSPTFWDSVEKTCEVAIALTPEAKARALATGTPVESVAELVCGIADVLEPFVREESEKRAGRKLAVPAVRQAVEIAKGKGVL